MRIKSLAIYKLFKEFYSDTDSIVDETSLTSFTSSVYFHITSLHIFILKKSYNFNLKLP